MRCVLITGVSRGLGEALFAESVRQGDRVVGLGRRFTAAQHRLAADRPDQVILLAADLADPGSLPDPPTLAAALGSSTEVVLLHNAAVVEPVGMVGALPAAQVAAAVLVNLTAPVLLSNAFLAAVPAGAQRIRVLFVSSSAANRTTEGTAVYSATKRGAEKFFDVLAAELAADPRVVVASVDPGIMDTDMQSALRTADFPHRDRLVGRYRRGELQDPLGVARQILARHVTSA